MRRILIAFLLVSSTASYGARTFNYMCDPCCPYWCGALEYFADALFWRPTTCQVGYVINDPRTPASDQLPQGRFEKPCLTYDFGFRIGLGYIFHGGCYDVRLNYTQLQTKGRDFDVAPLNGGLWGTIGHPNDLQQRFDDPGAMATFFSSFEYNAVDLNFGWRWGCRGEPFGRLWVGLHYFNIDHKERITIEGLVNEEEEVNVLQKAEMWGLGPRTGFEFRYPIYCGFGIGGQVTGGLLSGDMRRKTEQNADEEGELLPELLLESTGNCNVATLMTARLGVNFELCSRCSFYVIFEGGYEFTSYIGALGVTRFNDVAGTSHLTHSPLNFDGFYLSARLQI